jgi:hypothetical protein
MTLNRTEVIQAAKDLVAEAGEGYVYPGAAIGQCSYDAHDGIPACLVGQIVERLDPEKYDLLVQFENGGVPHYNEVYYTEWGIHAKSIAGNVTPLIDTGDDDELGKALLAAQNRQDNGKPWADAIQPILALES